MMPPVSDYTHVWMALITERERVNALVMERRDPVGIALTEEQVVDMQQTVTRLDQLAALAHERRDQVIALFAGLLMTKEEHAAILLKRMKESAL